MASRRPPSRSKVRQRIENTLALLIPLVFVGLAIADFQRDGQIDKYILGILFVFGIAALGYRVDSAFEKWLEYRSGRQVNDNDAG